MLEQCMVGFPPLAMHLTSHTDYALRCLIMLGIAAPNQLTIGQISETYGISENHVVKIIGRLAKLGYLETTRGKYGGVQLAMDPTRINLGKLVQQIEPELGVVACLRDEDVPCVIDGACVLRGALAAATQSFLDTLSQYTLADTLKPKRRLERLLQLSVRR